MIKVVFLAALLLTAVNADCLRSVIEGLEFSLSGADCDADVISVADKKLCVIACAAGYTGVASTRTCDGTSFSGTQPRCIPTNACDKREIEGNRVKVTECSGAWAGISIPNGVQCKVSCLNSGTAGDIYDGKFEKNYELRTCVKGVWSRYQPACAWEGIDKKEWKCFSPTVAVSDIKTIMNSQGATSGHKFNDLFCSATLDKYKTPNQHITTPKLAEKSYTKLLTSLKKIQMLGDNLPEDIDDEINFRQNYRARYKATTNYVSPNAYIKDNIDGGRVCVRTAPSVDGTDSLDNQNDAQVYQGVMEADEQAYKHWRMFGPAPYGYPKGGPVDRDITDMEISEAEWFTTKNFFHFNNAIKESYLWGNGHAAELRTPASWCEKYLKEILCMAAFPQGYTHGETHHVTKTTPLKPVNTGFSNTIKFEYDLTIAEPQHYITVQDDIKAQEIQGDDEIKLQVASEAKINIDIVKALAKELLHVKSDNALFDVLQKAKITSFESAKAVSGPGMTFIHKINFDLDITECGKRVGAYPFYTANSVSAKIISDMNSLVAGLQFALRNEERKRVRIPCYDNCKQNFIACNRRMPDFNAASFSDGDYIHPEYYGQQNGEQKASENSAGFFCDVWSNGAGYLTGGRAKMPNNATDMITNAGDNAGPQQTDQMSAVMMNGAGQGIGNNGETEDRHGVRCATWNSGAQTTVSLATILLVALCALWL